MAVFEQCAAVKDKGTFLEFLSALRQDFVERPDEWENVNVGDFLSAVHAWVADYHGTDHDLENPDWKSIAAMFYMGKIYE